ncbi:MAG: universal stress protein [Humidesulfovibrio sp.]|uniref:universal stress protein n=1 Tax=Humidesulfovibrio sp. TaxID=2910988 RepID=UPI0027FA081D|nr:universal stress protein [Humidesulfovibrio sp.]MDQ7835004.1 universal stress protein [Humidesulfovibrio sp.]
MKILLALDDTARAVDEALRLASEKGASLTALFVLDTGWSVYIGSDFLLGSTARSKFLEYTRDDELSQEQASLAAFRRQAEAAGVAFDIKTASGGRIAKEIIMEAAQGYDLLVMAAPFRRGLEVMRDAPSAILKAATCDVLFVRGGE